MSSSKKKTILQELLQKPYFEAEEAKGLSTRMLAYYQTTGLLERIGKGVYRSSACESSLPPDIEELVLTTLGIPNGVICLVSALYYYELTDETMREYWIAVPNKQRAPKRPLTRILRMRNTELGQTTIRIGAYRIPIFDRERTLVDAFRYLSHEVAIKALKEYLKSSKVHKPNLKKLTRYARILRVKIEPYILALTL